MLNYQRVVRWFPLISQPWPRLHHGFTDKIWGFPRQGHLPRSWLRLCESTIWVPASSLGECCAVYIAPWGVFQRVSVFFFHLSFFWWFWWRLINWMDIECTNWMVNLTFRPVCCCELLLWISSTTCHFPEWFAHGEIWPNFGPPNFTQFCKELKEWIVTLGWWNYAKTG